MLNKQTTASTQQLKFLPEPEVWPY